MSVKENLRMGAYLIDDEEFLGRQYEEVFDMFPVLEEKRAQRAGDLSGGQQMMVAFGRALMPDPDILLLDEPSAGLAPDLVDDVFEQVEVLKDRGRDMLIIEQNVRRVLEIAEYVYVPRPRTTGVRGRDRVAPQRGRHNGDVHRRTPQMTETSTLEQARQRASLSRGEHNG